MALTPINVGTAPDDGTGDPARTAFTRTNEAIAAVEDVKAAVGLEDGEVSVGAYAEPGSGDWQPGDDVILALARLKKRIDDGDGGGGGGTVYNLLTQNNADRQALNLGLNGNWLEALASGIYYGAWNNDSGASGDITSGNNLPYVPSGALHSWSLLIENQSPQEGRVTAAGRYALPGRPVSDHVFVATLTKGDGATAWNSPSAADWVALTIEDAPDGSVQPQALASRGRTLTKPSDITVTVPLLPVTTAQSYHATASVRAYRPTGVSNTYWVDGRTGDDANAGTEAAPFKTISEAMSQASTDMLIYVAPSVYLDEDTLNADLSAKPSTGRIAIERWTKRQGEVIITAGVSGAWAANATYPVVFARSVPTARTAVDLSVRDRYGCPLWYAELDSVEEVAAVPGSYFRDGNTIHVHALNGQEPNANVITTTNRSAISSTSTATCQIFLQGLRVIGGQAGVSADNASGNVGGRLFCVDVHTWASFSTGFNTSGLEFALFEDCYAINSGSDAFHHNTNVTSSLGTASVMELRCKAFGAGHRISNESGNAFTAHATTQIVRVACEGGDCKGPVFADVGTGSRSWNVGCVAHRSQATASFQWAGFQSLAGNISYFYECETYSTPFGLVVESAGRAYIDGCHFTSIGGGGPVTEYTQG